MIFFLLFVIDHSFDNEVQKGNILHLINTHTRTHTRGTCMFFKRRYSTAFSGKGVILEEVTVRCWHQIF